MKLTFTPHQFENKVGPFEAPEAFENSDEPGYLQIYICDDSGDTSIVNINARTARALSAYLHRVCTVKESPWPPKDAFEKPLDAPGML